MPLASCSCQQSLVALSLQVHHPSLCLHLHMVFSTLRISVSKVTSYKKPIIGVGPTLIQSDLILMNDT